ncbi:CynX/NimT family MFS transporter [Pararhizobium mangrovi]|nr:MFS transporter [Pararhizobium mangrovi]
MTREPSTGDRAGTTRAARLFLAASFVLVAFNLRPVFSSASVLLPDIIEGTGISAFAAGVLTTAPVVCLGLFALLAPRLAGRFGAERTLFVLLLLLVVGVAMRGLGTVPLFLGTAIAGACIAVGNVLMPGLVKRDFSDHASLMMGLYTMALTLGAAVAAGVTVPLQRAFSGSWKGALAIWALPAVIAALVWLPQVFGNSSRARRATRSVEGLWRDPLAWQVTLFMGLQASLAYSVFGWLATILRTRGMAAGDAGALVSFSILVQVVSCIATPLVAARCRDERPVNTALALFATLGLVGFVFLPLSLGWILAILQGAGQGGLIAIALTMIVRRSPDSHVAAHLSGMAQCVGYLLASLAPLAIGIIRDLTGGFTAAGILFACIGTALLAFGLGAGRNLHVGARAIPG